MLNSCSLRVSARPCACRALAIFVGALALLPVTGALAQEPCGDVYAGTWRNPPFGYDIYLNSVPFQFTGGVFDAPDSTPIALDSTGNVFHAQTIDAQGGRP